MRADACFTQWDVEFAAAATFSRASRLAPLFGLVFRRSSCQHPLLAGALGAAQPRRPNSRCSAASMPQLQRSAGSHRRSIA